MKPIHFVLLFIASLIYFMNGCQHEHEVHQLTEPVSLEGFMQHNVYFYLKDEVTEEERENFEEGLKALLEIPHIYKSELGVPAPTEDRGVIDSSYAYTIFTWFESLEDHDLYQVHPDHVRFIEDYNHLWENVRVYDADIIYAR
ncbi:MAG: Dabb family protein [Balneolaceae bacterium]|nr:MAG: Dabb family protein [Balneolaceae bacterium]